MMVLGVHVRVCERTAEADCPMAADWVADFDAVLEMVGVLEGEGSMQAAPYSG